MLVISRDLVLAASDDINLTHPLIGWHNVVTATNIVATSEEADYPASNLANPSTNLFWRGVTDSPAADDEYLTITTNEIDPIDYIAVAGHNWGSSNTPVTIEFFDESSSPADWAELVQEVILPDDGPVLFRFEPQSISQIRIHLRPGDAVPEAATVYCGALLVMERSFPVTSPHTPLDYGIETNVVSGMSESGKYLGRIQTGEHTESSAEFQYLTPGWYRSYFHPFVLASKTEPFFFAWHPSEYEHEIGFAWLINNPKPQVDPVTGRMHVSLQMRGVV